MGETVADIAGALVGIGIPESAAKQYQGRITSGAMLLSVHTGDLERLSQGKQVFEQTGAEDITATSAPTSYSPPEGGLLPFAGMNRPANAEPVGAPVIDLLGLAAVGVKP
jgi:hypothetical protein